GCSVSWSICTSTTSSNCAHLDRLVNSCPISNSTCFLRASITPTSGYSSNNVHLRIFCYDRQLSDRARMGRFRLLHTTGNESGARQLSGDDTFCGAWHPRSDLLGAADVLPN